MFTRRAELTCTEAEFTANPTKILLENELLTVKQSTGKRAYYYGDGVTPLSGLKPTFDFNEISDAVQASQTAEAGAESARDTVQASADQIATNTLAIDKLDAVINGKMELIETIIAGYNLTTTVPADWETNWNAYYTNTGTGITPVYTNVTGDAAPVWVADTYFSYDASGNLTIQRSVEPDGTAYNFNDYCVELNVPVMSPQSVAVHFSKLVYYYPWIAFSVGNTAYRTYYRVLSWHVGDYRMALASYHTNAPSNVGSILSASTGTMGVSVRDLNAMGLAFEHIPSGTEITIKGVRA